MSTTIVMQNRKFYRSRNHKIVAGVCGGLAEHFNLDVRVVRLLFVFCGLMAGITFILYAILWIAFPLNPTQKEQACVMQDKKPE